MSAHAILAPSSAAIRVACSGSRAMEAANPETEESLASREGTAAHWAAAELLFGRLVDVGLIAPNGVMLTDEMIEAAELYANDVLAETAENLVIERPVSCASIHAESWGTPDAWAAFNGGRRLVIWDFKFGHRYVEVFENWQLIEYAAGILDLHLGAMPGIDDQYISVEFRIIQPRCFVGGAPIRSWQVKASDLRGYFNILRDREAAAMLPDAPCTVNRHCIDCRGRALCRAAQSAGYDGMAIAASSVPFDLPAPALGAELRLIDRAIMHLEARRTGLAEQALTLIKRGGSVPFFKAEAGQGRQQWSRPDTEIIALGDMMGVMLSRPKLITPKQAEKAGLDASLVKAYSESPRGEVKLIPDDGSTARKVFSNYY
jgi:hypothetical protein